MSDIEQVKQGAAQVVATVKADAAKAASEVSQLDVDATKAKQAVLAKLNQEEGWIERNPGKVTLAGIGLVVAVIILLVKGCV